MKKQTGIGRRNLVDIKMGESREEMRELNSQTNISTTNCKNNLGIYLPTESIVIKGGL
jgi:hypothetical protein